MYILLGMNRHPHMDRGVQRATPIYVVQTTHPVSEHYSDIDTSIFSYTYVLYT